MKIYIAGHGNYGESVYSTLKFFKEDIQNVDILHFSNSYESEMEEYIKENSKNQLIVITDLLGGSVNACAMKLLQKYDFELYTGVNISFLLEILFRDSISKDDMNEIFTESKKQTIYMNDYLRRFKDDKTD